MPTSMSDVDNCYLEFCNKASNEIDIFKNFKRNKIYNSILEHCSQKQGLEYLKYIIKQNLSFKGIKKLLFLYTYLEFFKENDKFGNPKIYKYPFLGYISPSTIRYINVLMELEKDFGSLNDLKICEIGGGYGGQYKIIDSFFRIKRYTIIDLKPVLRLTEKYLSNYTLNSKIDLLSPDQLTKSSYDLVISNYAFSELNRATQDQYIDKVISSTKRGYFIYNNITPDYYKTYNVHQFSKFFTESIITLEKPQTGEDNKILIYGSKIDD